MENHEIILEYTGHLTFSTIGRLLTLLKYKHSETGIKTSLYKRILSVMIEALENIYKYSDHFHHGHAIYKNHLPTFLLEKNEKNYFIQVSNPVTIKDAGILKEKLDLINSKSTEELRILYRSTITNGKFTPKGGAGLGIIEMAKISGNPLEYSFKPINGEYAEYVLRICFG